MLVNVAFYLAPFVVCLPCAKWMMRFGYRRALVLALGLAASGAAIIAGSLWRPSFVGCLAGIFIMAMGVAAMQVVANPYVNRLGDGRSAAGRLSLASSINSFGAALAPLLLAGVLTSSGVLVSVLYIGLMLGGSSLLLILYLSRIDDFHDVGNRVASSLFTLCRYPQFRSGVSSIFVYVGVEVSIGTTVISYLNDAALGAIRLLRRRHSSRCTGGERSLDAFFMAY